ncbi:hypothetical protein Y032_0124g1233 [Ancylostoma ceylanicum]|uniref:Uncharacterized protein n=1 Tax=Ancylostoma ceylanicum TaxID=53326 RepID=A0A016T953_9BILA|nr:hypothetical protein Y032_0124g1233 [Ancylostoma ceylanicum]
MAQLVKRPTTSQTVTGSSPVEIQSSRAGPAVFGFTIQYVPHDLHQLDRDKGILDEVVVNLHKIFRKFLRILPNVDREI